MADVSRGQRFNFGFTPQTDASPVDLTDIMARINQLESELRRVNMMPNGGATAGTSFRPETSSATYFELWRGDFQTTGQYLTYDFTIYPNGNTMSWRIMAAEIGGTLTQVFEETAQTSNAQKTGTISLASAGLLANTGTNPLGRPFSIRLEAKVTAGAGQVGITVNGSPYVYKA